MSTTLLPQSFWFRLALRCPRIDGIPKPGRSRLFDLPDSCRLPCFRAIEGAIPWSEVRLAWNTSGLAVQVQVTGKVGPIVRDQNLPDASDCVHVWIDTRDARDVHRATKFCHHYCATLTASDKPGVEVHLRKIHRALADPTGARPERVQAQAERLRAGWRVRLFFPLESLHGFDIETNRRLGFYYQVTDPQRGDEWLAVGREFPIAENPSLWATLELVDS